MEGRSNARTRLGGLLLVLGLLATACSASANAGTAGSTGSGGLTLSIASPADGATVSEPFTVKLEASVPIGDPTTGDHHVHLCFDGGSCDELAQSVIAYADSVQVSGLSPGKHTIEASLRNADHSDSGVSAQITITVSDTAGTGTATGSGSGRANGY